jgi:hypothetical protein
MNVTLQLHSLQERGEWRVIVGDCFLATLYLDLVGVSWNLPEHCGLVRILTRG